jgi:excisionase family DNA binding protein
MKAKMKTLLIVLNHLIPALEAIRKDLNSEIAQKPEEDRITREELQDIMGKLNKSSKQKKFLTLEQVSDLLGLSKGYLYKQTSSKKIPYYKIGRKIVFEESKLNSWLEKSFKKPF